MGVNGRVMVSMWGILFEDLVIKILLKVYPIQIHFAVEVEVKEERQLDLEFSGWTQTDKASLN